MAFHRLPGVKHDTYRKAREKGLRVYFPAGGRVGVLLPPTARSTSHSKFTACPLYPPQIHLIVCRWFPFSPVDSVWAKTKACCYANLLLILGSDTHSDPWVAL